MPRDKDGNAERKAEDRQERKSEPKADPKGGRDRNEGHKDAEEHSRVQKGNRG